MPSIPPPDNLHLARRTLPQDLLNCRPNRMLGLAADCRRWALERGLSYVKTLAESCEDPRVRFVACSYLIDRGFGKPIERYEEASLPAPQYTVRELARIAAGENPVVVLGEARAALSGNEEEDEAQTSPAIPPPDDII